MPSGDCASPKASRVRATLVILVLVLLSAIPPQARAQRGAVVRTRNLAELTEQAQTIVVGRVVSARVEPHPQFKNLQTVLVSVAVSDTLKGSSVQTLTFRQYIWDPRDIDHKAGYARGQELLLFLNAENQYGLTSPAGLDQGRFAILRISSGKASAVNGHDNRNLFAGMAEIATTARMSARSRSLLITPAAGPVLLDDLRGAIRELAAGGPR